MGTYVPAQPTREYLIGIQQAWGLSMRTIAFMSGIPYTTLVHVSNTTRSINTLTQDAIMGFTPLWSTVGLQRRLEALLADGYTYAAVQQYTPAFVGVGLVNVRRGRNRTVENIEGSKQLIAAYEKLAGDNPEAHGVLSKSAKHLRVKARRLGYVPSLYWDSDTIDDPASFPQFTGRCGTRKGEQLHYDLNITVVERDQWGKLREFRTCGACRAYKNGTRTRRRK